MADATYQPKVYFKQGGNELVVASGGKITVESGGLVNDPAGVSVGDQAVTMDIADMSADATYYTIAPFAGTIKKIYAIVDGAIATADITVTSKINGTGVTNGVVTLPTAASGAGTTASATPTALNTVAVGDKISVDIAGGGSGGSPKGHLVFVISR